MNILRRELRANARSLLIWCGITALCVAIEFGEFTVYYNNPEYTQVLDAMPQAVISAFNIDAFNLTTATGFFGVLSSYLVLLLAIAAAMWGADIISKEERDRTVEYALTLPVTRARLITGKIAAALVLCAVLLGVTWVATLLAARRYAPDATFNGFVAIVMVSFALIQAIFLSVGIMLGCVMGGRRRAGPVAMFILLATYFCGFLLDFTDRLGFVRYLTPFRYYDPLLMLHESRLEARFVVLALVITVGCLAIGYAGYQRRDLHV
jgi:ABC-2 type transport system permease protein